MGITGLYFILNKEEEMRYKCYRCEQYIKDKFIFGLMHLCLTEDEYKNKLALRQMMKNQQNYTQGGLGSLNNELMDKLHGREKK